MASIRAVQTCGGVSAGTSVEIREADDEIDERKVNLAKRRGKTHNKSATEFEPNLMEHTFDRVTNREVVELKIHSRCGV